MGQIQQAAQAGSGRGRAAATPKSGKMADPLYEDPTAVWYVIPAEGGQYGPASAAVMRTWLYEGRIGLDTLVWRQGWLDWREARSVFPYLPELLERLASGGEAPQPTPGFQPQSQPVRPTLKFSPAEETASEPTLAWWVWPTIVVAVLIGVGLAGWLVYIMLQQRAGAS